MRGGVYERRAACALEDLHARRSSALVAPSSSWTRLRHSRQPRPWIARLPDRKGPVRELPGQRRGLACQPVARPDERPAPTRFAAEEFPGSPSFVLQESCSAMWSRRRKDVLPPPVTRLVPQSVCNLGIPVRKPASLVIAGREVFDATPVRHGLLRAAQLGQSVTFSGAGRKR